MLQSEKKLASVYREQISEQIIKNQLTNSTLTLDQLSLDTLDKKLSDKRIIASQLMRQRQRFNQSAFGSQHLALGAQLEADLALEWFAWPNQVNSLPERSGWPSQVCRLCSRSRPKDSSVGAKQASSSLSLDPTLQSSEPDEGADQSDDIYCEQFKSFPGNSFAYFIRPFVMTVQLLCASLTLALLIILLRVRKSRVSSNLQRRILCISLHPTL